MRAIIIASIRKRFTIYFTTFPQKAKFLGFILKSSIVPVFLTVMYMCVNIKGKELITADQNGIGGKHVAKTSRQQKTNVLQSKKV